ncbi:MAG: 30S ribosome-binding factor RbfA [Bdellovibrionota bacterium]
MSTRQERLAEQIRDILAVCFTGDNLRDPRVQGVTLTHVKLTGDLQLASIYFRVFDANVKSAAMDGLESCKGFLKKSLAKELDIRRVPELRFFYDESIETGSRIEELLSSIR